MKTPNTEGYPYQRPLLLSCVGLYAVFLLCLDIGLPLYGLLAVFAGFLLLARRVLLQIDWSLIFVFAAMFIDVGLFTLPPLQPAFAAIAGLSDGGVYAGRRAVADRQQRAGHHFAAQLCARQRAVGLCG